LAISPDGTRLVVGAYNADGIRCYDAISGEELWRRKDKKGVQTILISPDGNRVFCEFADGPLHVMDVQTGSTIESKRAVTGVFESPFESAAFLETRSGSYRIERQSDEPIKVERETAAILSVACAPGRFLVSETGGLIRCLHVADGREAWRFSPDSGTHALVCGFDETLHQFAAVLWPYQTGGDCIVARFDPASGEHKGSFTVRHAAVFGFLMRGSQLLSWDGTIRTVADGQVVTKLDFPDTSNENIDS
jgi:WD40 repeat protein